MRNIFILLILTLFCNTALAQVQLPMVPTVELPPGYETWQGQSNKLVTRADLVIEFEQRVYKDKSSVKVLRISRINSDIVYVFILNGVPDGDSYELAGVTLYWLAKEGYYTANGPAIQQPNITLQNQVSETWKNWDKYVREKYKINDKEMAEMERFLEL
ncbi:MAG: hypothetical protein Q8Q89_02005 [bacterium]|nr:hypothetical protein [bacterium]